MKNIIKEREKAAGDFSIFICAAKSGVIFLTEYDISQIAPRLRYGTRNE